MEERVRDTGRDKARRGLRQRVLELESRLTALSETELQLRASEGRSRRAEAVAHVGSWELELATGAAHWSDEFFRICGCEPGAITPSIETGFSLIHPDDRARASAAVEASIERAEPYDLEKRIVRPSGEIRHVRSIGEVVCDDAGRPQTLIGAFFDITEHKRNEGELAHQAAQLTALANLGRDLAAASTLAEVEETVSEALARDLALPGVKLCLGEVSSRATPSNAVLPLLSEGVCVGEIVVEGDKPAGPEQRILEMLAQQASAAIQSVRRLKRLLEQAHTDELTGLINRRALRERATSELARARRYGRMPSLLVWDIDRFKSINDELGHHVGDHVLRAVSEQARSTLRASDVVARWGGDEFVALLPETELACALDAAERLRAKVRESGDGPWRGVSITVGAAACTGGGMPFDELLARADKALLAAKRAGGDRVGCSRKA